MPRDRPLRSQATRDRILAAARRAFAAEGYERTTVRAVAADAQSNPSLVIRYYGSKAGLFAAAAKFDLRLPDLSEVPRESLGQRLVAHFLKRWEHDPSGNELVVLLRASVSHEAARARMMEIFETQLTKAVAQVCGAETAPVRAALIASQMLGIALVRYVLKLPAPRALDESVIIDQVGRTIQSYLVNALPVRP
jgi:AcrR family transcriptional regulator